MFFKYYNLLVYGLLIVGCANQQVVMHPSRQNPKTNSPQVNAPKTISTQTNPQLNNEPAPIKILEKPPVASAGVSPAINLINANTSVVKKIIPVLPKSTLIIEADPKVIGAVLPLTGKNSSIGVHALNAIRMGLELNKPDAKFRLALFDSQSNAEMASKGVDKLIKEDKAIAIIGGFTAKEASAIATRAEYYSTAHFGFSQKSGLTNIGESVFRNAVTPEMQTEKIVQFSLDKLSAKKFAILFPNDSYGVELSNIFWDQVLARGGEVTAVQSYDPKETDFSIPIQKLVGTYYAEARLNEYNQILKNRKGSKKFNPEKKLREHADKENVLPPIVDFDVIFVPDNSKALGQILAFMRFNSVSGMDYLGTNLWNSPDLPKRAVNEEAGIYFVDAVDVSNAAKTTSSFFKDYLTLHNEEHTMVEIQTFEAAQIIKEQLNTPLVTRESLINQLASLGRRPGVTGELKMSEERELIRPLHILTLDAGIVKKVE